MMRRRPDRGYRKRPSRRLRRLIIFLLMTSAVIYSFQIAEKTVKPAVSSSAEFKTRMVIEKLVIQSVQEVTEKAQSKDAEIIHTTLDENGKISIITLDTNLLNLIGTEVSRVINENISETKEYIAYVNLGTILSSRVLSQILPSIELRVIPSGVSDISYATEFESAGINQTKYKVYINIDTEARLRIPFMTERIYTENTILIAEAVIVGDVPDTYADITQDEVSDYIS